MSTLHAPETLQMLDKLLRIFDDGFMDQKSSRRFRLRRSGKSDAVKKDLVKSMVNMVNAAYHRGEQGMWCDLDGWARTDEAEVVRGLQGNRFIIAFKDETEIELIGCIRIDPSFDSDGKIGEFGMLAVDEEFLGLRVATRLIRAAERTLKELGCQVCCLELLRPNDWEHPEKIKLHEWYSRIGYRLQPHKLNLAELNPHLAHLLATDCTLHVYHKAL